MQPEMNRRSFLGVGLTAIASTAIKLPSSPASDFDRLMKPEDTLLELFAQDWVSDKADAVGVGPKTLSDVKLMLSPSLRSPPWVQGTENEALFKAYSFAGHFATLETSWQQLLDWSRRYHAKMREKQPDSNLEEPDHFLKMITQFSPSTVPSKIEALREVVLNDRRSIEANKYILQALEFEEREIRKYLETFAEQPLLVALKEESERLDSPLAPLFKEWREKLLSWQLAELRNDAVLSLLGRLYMNEVDGTNTIPGNTWGPEYVLFNPCEWPAELPGPGLSETERAALKVEGQHDPSFVHFAFSRDVEQELLKELRTRGIDFSIAAIYPPETKALFDRCDRLYAQIEVEELNRRMVFSDHIKKEAATLQNELIEYVCGGYTQPTDDMVGANYPKLSEFGLPRPFFFIRRFQDVADATDCYSVKYVTQHNAFAWKLWDPCEDIDLGNGWWAPGARSYSTPQLTYGRRSYFGRYPR